MSDMNKCVGCDHALSSHFVDVQGVARCLQTEHGTSSRGVLGIPYVRQCDCANFTSPTVVAARQREAEQRAEYDELVEMVRAEMGESA